MTKIRNKELLERFGKNLRRIRLEKGMTQEYLADEAGVSQVQIARIESGQLNTTISTLDVIAKALDSSPNEFFI